VYTALLAWGFGVGVRLIWQAYRKPASLLNPLYSNRGAARLFTLHMVVVSADLFVIGPWSVANKSTLWYWGGRVAILSSSLPIAAFLNRNPQSFGKLIGVWVRLRNLFEISLHIAVAAAAVVWFNYYLLLWWIVAYRFLDVGPRRALQKLYNTPEKKAARPWAPLLNWGVIATLYVLTFLVIDNEQVIYAKVPPESLPEHVNKPWEVAVVLGVNVVLAVATWVMTKKYTQSLVEEAGKSVEIEPLGGEPAHAP
jgi:hypothetical protein